MRPRRGDVDVVGADCNGGDFRLTRLNECRNGNKSGATLLTSVLDITHRQPLPLAIAAISTKSLQILRQVPIIMPIICQDGNERRCVCDLGLDAQDWS
jgi:hypothetical protein